MYRQIEEKDVETIQSLYHKYPDFPKPLRATLPGNGLDGYVAVVDDTVVAATYVFMAVNAPYVWIEWTVADRDFKSEDKSELVSGMIEYTCNEMKKRGYNYAFAFANKQQQGLIEIYDNAGFDVESDPTFEMIKQL